MNGKIKIRHIYKAEELKRFAKLEGKYHHMGETHSGGDTMRIVFEDGNEATGSQAGVLGV